VGTAIWGGKACQAHPISRVADRRSNERSYGATNKEGSNEKPLCEVSCIAAVATMGYFGFLSGPPLIGFIAAMAGLPVALSLGIISGSVIAIVGAVVVRRVRTAAF